MHCPFISQLPATYLAKYSSNVVRTYLSSCPVMSRGTNVNLRTYSSSTTNEPRTHGQVENVKAHNFVSQEASSSQCPFLTEIKPTLVAANADMVQDIHVEQADHLPTSQPDKAFEYASFFSDQIMRKKQDHSYRIFKKVARFAERPPFAQDYASEQKAITVWCSNDYLGMSSHPEVKQAVIDAVKNFGSGSGGTRNISGNTPFHEDLEQELASLHKKEAALLFTSCFVANDSTLMTLGKALPNCHIFSDAGNHASMIQGIRNSGAKKSIFRTCDPIHLEQLLSKVDVSVPKLVVFETVHSMTGAISPIEELCDVAHKYGAITFVDEVHAVGLYGDEGAGVAQRDGLMDKLDMVSGTLGKAYGNIGGYVAASSNLIDMILRSDEGRELRRKHQENVNYFKNTLTRAGLPQLPSVSHIIPVPLGDAQLCTSICNELLSHHGQYVQSINYPTVPKGEERLRIAPTPFHTKPLMDEFIGTLKQVWVDNDLPLLKDKCAVSNCFYCHRPLPKNDTCASEVRQSYPCGDAVGCPQLSATA
ncbi:5-aminolevulinate synthase, erythroid-specific, mitochondrial [Halotydeus destructor]|nr:5-aminolevulinate synthase, erythroid-specific, mitochondrial [Halotydeus destructor]